MFKKIGITKDGLELVGIEDVKSGKKTLQKFLKLEKETKESKLSDQSMSQSDEEDKDQPMNLPAAPQNKQKQSAANTLIKTR